MFVDATNMDICSAILLDLFSPSTNGAGLALDMKWTYEKRKIDMANGLYRHAKNTC